MCGILDIKAMYHSNANKYNISWDTLSPDGEDCGNGTKFRTDTKGVLIRQMDYMTKMRNEFKSLMKSDPNNIKKWDTMQFAAKTLVASMYGVAGDAKYGMYHPEIAAAITHTSRSTLHELMDEAEAEGFKVLYGHTDSVFCVIPTPESGLDVIDKINARMAPIEVEFEKWCSRMILVAKNRYTGMTAWTDGSYHDPTLYVKGIEFKAVAYATCHEGGHDQYDNRNTKWRAMRQGDIPTVGLNYKRSGWERRPYSTVYEG